MSTRIEVAVMNDKGLVRGNNEDNFFFNDKFMPRNNLDLGGLFAERATQEHQLYAVCDGMGGADAGEEAALCAVIALSELLARGDAAFELGTITHFVQSISDRVYLESQQRGGALSGCTIAAMIVNDGYMRLLHVGDSRIYRLRKKRLTRMTKDHSEVQRMIDMNMISETEAHTHPKRHVITQYMGMPPMEVTVSPAITDPEPLRKGDIFLICSDGITDMLEDARIQQIMSSTPKTTDLCKQLIGEALKNGGTDNATAMCVRILGAHPGNSLRTLIRKMCACALLIGLNIAAIATLLWQLY